MNVPVVIAAVIVGLMLAEARLSRRNEIVLRERPSVRWPAQL